MNTPISVGLIGLGRHGSRYLAHLTKEETGGKLFAISRNQKEEGYRQAAHYQIQFFPDYRALIANPAIQAILVVTPPTLNIPIALEAIKHQKAVLVEKPLALNSNEGKRLLNAATQTDVPLMTGHTLRYEPVIQKLREIGQTLGPWKSLNGTMHLEERPETNGDREVGNGVLLEFGIHLLDWVRTMIPREPLTVSANMTCSSPGSSESHAEITMTTRTGLSCHLDIARVSTKRVTEVEIVGTKGRVQGNWTKGLLQTFENETLVSEEILPPTPTIVLMLKDFFQALQTSQSVPITGEDGLRAVELAESCYQAAKTKHPVHFQQ